MVAVPRSISSKRFLIYIEAAREQALKPAGNPLKVEKVPIPDPEIIDPGHINDKMEKLIRILQQYLTPKQGLTVVLVPVKANNNRMQACCCCC